MRTYTYTHEQLDELLDMAHDRGFDAGYRVAYDEMQRGEFPKAPIGEV